MRLNPNILGLVCSKTGDRIAAPPTRPWGRSPAGAPLLVEYSLETLKAESRAYRGTRQGLFRYEPLLPVVEVPSSYAADVGCTPVMESPALGRELGVELFFKNEATNPSGSFKDRGLAMAVALSVACGAKRICLPTQGNAGVAAALFSARQGLPGAVVYMPEPHRGSAYHRAAVAFGASVHFHGANIASCGHAMREALSEPLRHGDIVDVSTFFEPGRLEGKKTLGFELFDRFGAEGLPEAIFYPTGGGTGLVGIWKAFQELVELGELPRTARLPRLIAVQSERCAPVVEAFERGDDGVTQVRSQGTVADGLDVPGAIMGHGILSALRQSGGSAVAVSEEEIEEGFSQAGRSGVSVSFEGATACAGLKTFRSQGHIGVEARVLVLNTAGHQTAIGRQMTDALPTHSTDHA